MMLTDRDIIAYQGSTSPLVHGLEDPELQIQPASVDLRLGDELKVFADPVTYCGSRWLIDVTDDCDDIVEEVAMRPNSPYVTMPPGSFMLGHTVETVRIPSNVVGRVDGRSSLGRLGLVVHATAGFIDPGFEGQITLEFYNMNAWPLRVHRNIRICQISFERLERAVLKPYGSGDRNKYQGQLGATSSRMGSDK